MIGSKAFSASANPCSKGCCRIIDCSGQVRLINLDQLSPFCRTSLMRELVLARARIDTGSKKNIRISTSSGVLQNIFSASMWGVVLGFFFCINPCNSNFALPHNAKHLAIIVFVQDLSINLNFICYTFRSWSYSALGLGLGHTHKSKKITIKRSNIRNIWGECGQKFNRSKAFNGETKDCLISQSEFYFNQI